MIHSQQGKGEAPWCIRLCFYFIYQCIISSVGGWLGGGSIETKYNINIGTKKTHLVQ